MMKKNQIVTIKHLLGETAEALVTRLEDGRYQFNCDAYVSGEKCKGGFFHLRQAREVIPGKKLGDNIKFWPRLRKALHVAGVKRINIPGGEYPIHYCDEIVIPDYKVTGSHYFVIKRSDIGKYLEQLPLDDRGKAHADDIARQVAEAAAEEYRQKHDPKCIAKRIGNALYSSIPSRWEGEFVKISLIAEDSSEFSVLYPTLCTNLLWKGYCNIPKVLCSAPEIGIDYLAGTSAGSLDPRKHNRIQKMRYAHEWAAFLMPNPNLASETRDYSRWLWLFDGPDNDGVSPELIANAKLVIVESLDLHDVLIKERYVYEKDSEKVFKQCLHNCPYYNQVLVEEPDWRTE